MLRRFHFFKTFLSSFHFLRVAIEEPSDLCCDRLLVTAIKQARRQGQRRNSLRRAGCVGRTDGFSPKKKKKKDVLSAIRGTARRSTSDIRLSTEGRFKTLGSGTVPTVTSESKLLRHSSKCSGPCWNASVSGANRGLLSLLWKPTFDPRLWQRSLPGASFASRQLRDGAQ